MSLKIYFPMTANILTPGHIKCLEYLSEMGDVIIGLLTKKALLGYKKEMVSFNDRKFILEHLGYSVVAQNSLNPERNLKKYMCTHIASGDGWEQEEIEAIKKLNIQVINIKLKGEKSKKYSSSKILTK